jgi:hypothetical protein
MEAFPGSTWSSILEIYIVWVVFAFSAPVDFWPGTALVWLHAKLLPFAHGRIHNNTFYITA